MPSAAFTKFDNAILDMANAKHNFGSHTFKVYLSNAAPNHATNNVKSNVAEITAGNGYTAGGYAVTLDAVTQTGGVLDVSTNEATITITASGGSIGPFRYVVLYNDTDAGDALLASFDYGSVITVQDGETFDIVLPASLFTGSFA